MKTERVYRQILYERMEKGIKRFTQKALAQKCMMSIGNVNKALKKLEDMNAIEKKIRGFRVIDPKKILLYWASIRNINREVIYSTHFNEEIEEIEKLMPADTMFTCYSGYKFLFKNIPSDYSEIWVYANENEMKKRFPETKGKPNIFVLRFDEHLKTFKRIPLCQLFVDLWNMNTWYAKDFLNELEKRLKI